MPQVNSRSKKSAVIVSNGPLPPQKNYKIEGSGIRVWLLAHGLIQHGIDVTILVNESYDLQGATSFHGISVAPWSSPADIAASSREHDALIMSYSMGRKSSTVAKKLHPNTQFILDCYVPIYVEVSARGSANITNDYKNYFVDLGHYNKSLQRGDYFLYANEHQKRFYDGALSALGVINPYSYNTPRLVHTPLGVSNESPAPARNPYQELGLSDDDKVLLWFGGLYPWFNITDLIKAVQELRQQNANLKFVIVGGKNPYNKTRELTKTYQDAVAYCEKEAIMDSLVYFVDWVDYDDRVNWYHHADAVISINNPGDENMYSWRTRVIDYLWAEVPLLSNGGDPLTEELLDAGYGDRLNSLSSDDIQNSLRQITTKSFASSQQKAISRLKQRYSVENSTAELAEVIKSGATPWANEQKFRRKIGYNILSQSKRHLGLRSKAANIIQRLKKQVGR